ncbi:amidohydrolase family protein [Pseudooceanicola sp. CBS1P-1]|uniref:Amidohydrolase family protein n=1 Tax=Pseudooceanicola albus TaxID=2692189 RepID=A0A6L7G9S6_9RHOB|nr:MULTISPECIES: amidohydrolase family protein [Pseudooceanicola]MBT9386298.1 amidohydrolase family protein [Pseudooceanicola endophyticus]MXN20347.1 amidohydrolase family protein [Pseudooceanicola albus]
MTVPKPARAITGIDTHAHIFNADQQMAEGRRYTPEYDATLIEWLGHQDRAGISHGVLVQPSFLGTDNGLIAEALSGHRDRLRGIAVVDPEISEAELARLNDQGFVGARLNLVGKTPEDYADAGWQRFFQRLAALDWQVEIQRAFEDFATIAPPIAAAGCTVMIDHFGLPQGGIDPANPAHAAVLEMLRATPRAWVKLSAPYRSGQDTSAAARSLAALREACGGLERFCWGSDWPHTRFEAATGYDAQLARLEALLPDPAERRTVLVENPAPLFRFN